MKLRILDNTIRIRISRIELLSLRQGNAVTSQTIFPSGSLNLTVVANSEDYSNADFDGQTIQISIPSTQIIHLNDSDQVGLEFSVLSSNEPLTVIFEKDFKCLTDRDEDESHLFENPLDKHPC